MRNPLLLILAGDAPDAVISRHGNFDGMFLASADFSGFDLRTVRVFAGERPLAPEEYCGVIVTGSARMATEQAPWMLETGDWLRLAVQAGLPVLGVCFGHQLIAQALGGDVDFHPLGMELGTHQVTLYPGVEPHPWLAGLPGSFPANQAHSQTVREVYGVSSEGVWADAPKPHADSCHGCQGCIRPRVLACSGHDPHQIVAYGENCLTLQFHPEFNAEIMRDYVELYGSGPKVRLGVPVGDTPQARSILDNFLNGIRRAG